MRNNLLIWILCFFALGDLKVLASTDYGLYFKSHSAPGNERTSLALDENSPFRVKNEFTIDFQMWVRNEPDFGAILHLCTNCFCGRCQLSEITGFIFLCMYVIFCF